MKENGRVESFQPHMHLRGKAMSMEAILPERPDADAQLRERLQLQLDNSYVYADDAAPLLPKGTILKVTAWHDNTSANKNNPDPNVWVGYGDRTVDEMAHAWVNVTYMGDDDYKAELAARKAKIARAHDAAATAVTPETVVLPDVSLSAVPLRGAALFQSGALVHEGIPCRRCDACGNGRCWQLGHGRRRSTACRPTGGGAAAHRDRAPPPAGLSQGLQVFPAIEGWGPLKDGTNAIQIGYFNRNRSQVIDVPISTNDRIEPGGPDMGQPTHFEPGRHYGVFAIAVPEGTLGNEKNCRLDARQQRSDDAGAAVIVPPYGSISTRTPRRAIRLR